jgi:hypothetical protein
MRAFSIGTFSGLLQPTRMAVGLALLGALFVVHLLFPALLAQLWKLWTAPFVAFSYPVELEWRESPMWLYVLAQAQGVDIYDHASVAFMGMGHGPLDPLLKYWIYRLLPELSPWQNTRLFVLLLPFALIVASAILLRDRRTGPAWAAGVVLGVATYVVLLTARAGVFLLVGGSDATAHVLAIAAIICLAEMVRAQRAAVRLGFAAGAGLLCGAACLTVWRVAPFIAAVAAVNLLALKLEGARWRSVAEALGAVALGAVAIAVFLFYRALHGDLDKVLAHFYWIYFVGETRPHGIPLPSMADFPVAASEFLNEGRHLWIMALFPAVLWLAHFVRRDGPWSLWFCAATTVLYALTLVALFVGYWHNVRGTQIHYLLYVFLFGWFVFCLVVAAAPAGWRRFLVAFALGALLIVTAIGGMAESPMAGARDRMAAGTDAARAFDYALAQLWRKYTMVSDSNHFFKRTLRGDRVDMGDYAWSYARRPLFDPAFARTVADYYASIAEKRPEIIVVGAISAPPLRDLVASGYSCIVCGVPFIPYGARGFSLYARNDLPLDELRAQFAPFRSDGQ